MGLKKFVKYVCLPRTLMLLTLGSVIVSFTLSQFSGAPLLADRAGGLNTKVNPGTFTVLRAEFHAHSNCSDGDYSPTALVDHYKSAGYDVLCLTDHRTTEGFEEAQAEGDKVGLIVIRGEELTYQFPDNSFKHVLGLFLNQTIVQNSTLYGNNTETQGIFDEIHSLGGLGIVAHPWDTTNNDSWLYWQSLTGASYIDGWEFAAKKCTYAWRTCILHNNIYLRDHDFHDSSPVFLSTDYTLLLSYSNTTEGVREALESHRIVSYVDGVLYGNPEALATYIENQDKMAVTVYNIGLYAYVLIVGDGTVTKSPSQEPYELNTNVTFTANASDGYAFAGWSGDASGTSNPITINMTNSNKVVTATFTAISHQYIFYDEFETGNYSAWDYNVNSTNFFTSTESPYNGTYSNKLVFGTGFDLHCRKNITSLTTIFIRIYVKFSAVPSVAENRWGFIRAYSGNQEIARAGMTCTSSGARWNLRYYKYGSGFANTVNATLTPAINTWHLLELKVVTNSTEGEVHMSLDWTEILSKTSINTGSAGIDSVRIGLMLSTNEAVTVYEDCVVIDNV